MKVLQINNVHYRRGGADAVYLNTAELLQEHGDEVVFFNMKKEGNLPCKDEKYWVSSMDSRPAGIKSALLELRNFFYNPEAKIKIEELINAEKPEIAHVHLFWGSGISPSITEILKKHHIPLVQTVHDYRMICPIALLMNKQGRVCEKCKGKKFYKAGIYGCSQHGRMRSIVMAAEMYYHNRYYQPLNVVDGFIFVSDFSYKKHLQYVPRLRDANTTVLYNFAILDGHITRNTEESYLLFYGRLSYEKGIKTLLESVKICSDIRLKVVGTGPMEQDLKAEYEGYSNITFMGYQTGEKLKGLIRNAQYVCVTSECYENNPMTIVEAYSMGTPVIGSRIGGIPEIVKDGVTGFQFEMGNTEALRQTILRAKAVDAIDYEKMREGAHQFYQLHFSPEKYYKKLLDFYKHTIDTYEC